MNTYFCDGIKQVTLINGVARVEFFRLQNTNAVEPAADAPVELTLAVPAAGLIQMISALERLRDQLIEKGLLQPQPTVNGTSPARSEPKFSPNFPRQSDTAGQP
jgi:hypothetical protein